MMLRETLRALFAEYKNRNVVEQMEWDGEWVPCVRLEKIGIIPADEIAEISYEAGRNEESVARATVCELLS